MVSMTDEDGPLSLESLPLKRLRFWLERAEEFGLSSTKLLRECNASFTLADLQSGHIVSLSESVVAQISRLTHHCMMEIRKVVTAGYDCMTTPDFELLCHVLLSSTTLREVIDRTEQFMELTRRGGSRFVVENDEEFTSIRVYLGPAEQRWDKYFTIDAFRFFGRYYEWAIGEMMPLRFQVEWSSADEGSVIAQLYEIPLEYDCQANRILVPSSYLDKAVVRDIQELRQLLSRYPLDWEVPSTEAALSTRVAAIFRDAMVNHREVPSLVQIARKMGMAEATLRRHLAAEGETIRAIKDRLRIDVACKLLATKSVHIDQVAEILGFGSSKAFSRAFLSWRGLTPTAYRQQMLSGGTSDHCEIEPLPPQHREDVDAAARDFASGSASWW